LKTVEVR